MKKQLTPTAFRLLSLCLLMQLMAMGCAEHCTDKIYPSHSDAELAYFYFQPGDTLYFIDKIRLREHYLTCLSRTLQTDTIWMEQYQCTEGGSFDIRPVLGFRFESDLPFYNQGNLFLNMKDRTKSDSISYIEIEFKDAQGERYWTYDFEINMNNLSLGEHYLHHPVESMGTQNIQGEEYQDVYRLTYLLNAGEIDFFYDTLYYNKDGFLKFISSQFGYELERIE